MLEKRSRRGSVTEEVDLRKGSGMISLNTSRCSLRHIRMCLHRASSTGWFHGRVTPALFGMHSSSTKILLYYTSGYDRVQGT